MFITWHGLSCFRLFDKDTSIVMDPYDEKEAGLKLPDIKVDAITFSYQQEELKSTEKLKVFDWPGEFEAFGIPFIGVYSIHPKTKRETIIFKFTADNINICHLGMLDHIPEANVIDKLGKVDLLIAPAGGHDTISPKDLSQIIEDMEPTVIVPMLYDISASKKKSGATLEDFLKNLGVKEHQTLDKIDLKKTAFPAGRLDTIVLTPELG